MEENKKKLARLLLDLGLVKIAADRENFFTYASGAQGPVYCDNRPLISHVAHREWVLSWWWQQLHQRWPNAHALVGLATAGIPHGAWLAHLGRLPFAYIRSKPKEHGQEKLLEGQLAAGSKVVLIEDLVNRGSSSLPAIEALKSQGLEVLGISSLVNYGFPSVVEAFMQQSAPLLSLLDLAEILDLAQAEQRIPQSAVELVRAWLKS